jgi:ATP-dependent RNA helicase DeaD
VTIDQPETTETFAQLGLGAGLVQTLDELGYETPTPIQLKTIPLMLAGRSIIGQAQTGTGKTAAFALPILDRLDLKHNVVQALILAPTRELAIQVSEAIQTYSKHLGRVRTMPIYGGDSMGNQIGRLKAGLHIVVGTPGRIMDHLRRGTLELSNVKTVVIDEADEMLRMGFIEDVEWILGQTPPDRQTALFSATMPREVRRIADQHLSDPVTVEIKHKTLTVPTVEQTYINVIEKHKVDALTHLLEAEAVPGEAILIFVRTKVGAAGLVDKLQARGYAAEAMHGDMNQPLREMVIRRMRDGQIEIVAATDVAARGLDIENIGRVINFDIPNDPESYVHRIGRTARAGRAGKAISFVTPREAYMLREIERYTGQRVTAMKLPSRADVAARRSALFKEKLLTTLNEFKEQELEFYLAFVEELAEESGRDLAEIAASAVRLARGDKPLDVPVSEPELDFSPIPTSKLSGKTVQLFIGAGQNDGVRPSDIVGAIANEAELPGRHIGPIDIFDRYTLVGVPAEYHQQVLEVMAGTTIRGQATNIRLATAHDAVPRRTGEKKRTVRDGKRKSVHAKSAKKPFKRKKK